jgi:nitrogen fixation-related uncharacterized protein
LLKNKQFDDAEVEKSWNNLSDKTIDEIKMKMKKQTIDKFD